MVVFDAITALLSSVAPHKINFDDLSSHKVITEDGKNWLKIALDPFHDNPVEVRGYPDKSTTRSIVRCTKNKLSFAAPGAVAWDCLIMVRPFFRQSGINRMCSLTSNANHEAAFGYDHAALGTQFSLYDITCWRQNAGGTWNGLGAVATVSDSGTTFFPDDQCARFIGGGLEVINTAPDLYASGYATVGSMPFNLGTGNMYMYDTNGAPWTARNFHSFVMNSWPTSTAGFQQLPGVENWEARRGVYMPFKLTADTIPFETPQCVGAHTKYDPEGGSGTIHWVSSPAEFDLEFVARPDHTKIMDAQFILLTGLHAAATFDIVTRVWSEVPALFSGTAADYGNPGAVNPYVTPAAAYDPHAIELYGKLAPMLPVGVPRDENPAGEFFGNIVKTLGSLIAKGSGLLPLAAPLLAATPLAPAAPLLPAASVLGAAAGTGMQLAGSALKNASKRKTKQANGNKKKK